MSKDKAKEVNAEIKATEETVVPSTQEDNVMEGFDGGVEGLEGIEATLTSLPILTLTQALSPDVVNGEIDGLRAGMFMNSVTKEVYGNSLKVIVYKPWQSRCIMPPQGEGTFPICHTADLVNGMHSTLGARKCAGCESRGFSADSCRDQFWFIVAPVDQPNNLMRVNMWKTSNSAGKKLFNLLASDGKRYCHEIKGIYDLTYTLEAKKVEKSQYKYFVFDVKSSGLVNAPNEAGLRREQFMEACRLHKSNVDNFKDYVATSQSDTSDFDFKEPAIGEGVDGGSEEAAQGASLM